MFFVIIQNINSSFKYFIKIFYPHSCTELTFIYIYTQIFKIRFCFKNSLVNESLVEAFEKIAGED